MMVGSWWLSCCPVHPYPHHQVMIVHQPVCFPSQRYIWSGSHILGGLHAILLYVGLGLEGLLNTAGSHGWCGLWRVWWSIPGMVANGKGLSSLLAALVHICHSFVLLVSQLELAVIVSKSIVHIVLTPIICDPIVPVPPPFVVTALTLVTNCSIVLLSYYCIVTFIVFCYILPSTGLVLIVARILLYSLSRVSCQYRTSTHFYSILWVETCPDHLPLHLSCAISPWEGNSLLPDLYCGSVHYSQRVHRLGSDSWNEHCQVVCDWMEFWFQFLGV
jgi:hypothetical protein